MTSTGSHRRARSCGARLVLVGIAALALIGVLLIPPPARAQAPGEHSAVLETDCERICLLQFLHAYLDALAHRDPTRAPFAHSLRYTENNVPMPLGARGLWKSATGIAATGLELADTATGNAAWFGTVQEHNENSLLTLRLRVAHRQIIEVEALLDRRGSLPAPFGDPATLSHDPEFAAILPPQQRRPRERLLAIANGYFSTVELNDGAVLTQFDPDCQRNENGISTTQGNFGAADIAQGCEAQFRLGIYRINKRVRERRFPLVDEERGIVLATGFFDHANTFDTYTTNDGKSHSTALKWPNSITLMEAFKIRGGMIYRVEAVFTYVPYFMHSPWAPADDTVALQGLATFGAPQRDARARPAVVSRSLPAHTRSHPDPQATSDVTRRRARSEADTSGATASPGAMDPAHCESACLVALADQYMSALVSHRIAAAPWAQTVRFQENSVPMMVGDGLWGSVTAAGTSPLYATDPQAGTVALFGTVAEHGQPAFYAMQLQVRKGRIEAVQTLVARKQNAPAFGDPQTTRHDPAFAQEEPSVRRMTRRQLVALVNDYYDSLRSEGRSGSSQATATPRSLDTQCRRMENGVSEWPPSAAAPASCRFFPQPGGQSYAVRFRSRSYPVIDTAHGIVIATGYRDLEPRGDLPYSRTTGFIEAFKIAHGRIVRIESASTDLPYFMNSDWHP